MEQPAARMHATVRANTHDYFMALGHMSMRTLAVLGLNQYSCVAYFTAFWGSKLMNIIVLLTKVVTLTQVDALPCNMIPVALHTQKRRDGTNC